jgi:hypothetical protein
VTSQPTVTLKYKKIQRIGCLKLYSYVTTMSCSHASQSSGGSLSIWSSQSKVYQEEEEGEEEE